MRTKLLAVLAAVIILSIRPCGAQMSPAQNVRVFTIQQAVNYALANYPSVRAAMEQVNASKASVGLARMSYIPRLDSVWQGDRGSRESVLGVLLPQSPNILTGTQGSVTPHSYRPFWTSGAGVLLSWEPFDFGFRRAQVRSAQMTERRTETQVELTRLGVAAAVAEAALATLAGEQRTRASRADVDRREVFGKSVHALVDAHLRPGADASRAEAELAAARTRLILAEQSDEVDSAALAAMLGLAGSRIEIKAGDLFEIPPREAWAKSSLDSHPLAVAERQRIEEANARIRVLKHAFYPHFTTEALISARGSGQTSTGDVKPWPNGMGFDVYNWEAGVTASLDLTSIAPIQQRKKIELANRRREQAIYAQTIQVLTGQQQQALAQLAGARRVAENTPTELAASRQTEAQAIARFRAGLGTIVEVADAQSLLVQAEMDDSLARLRIWRALAGVAAAQGNLAPFLDMMKSTHPGEN